MAKSTKKTNLVKKQKRRTDKRKTNKRKMKGGNGDDCPICLDPLDAEETITTPCKHTFHKKCILDTCKLSFWNKNKKCLCPMCRGDIDVNIRKLLPAKEQFDPDHLTMETFPLFLNYTLSKNAEEDPFETLDDLLSSFSGGDNLPVDVHDPLIDDATHAQTPNIMEFKRLHISSNLNRKPNYIYQFEGFVKKIPSQGYSVIFNPNKVDKQYYRYVLDENGITFLQHYDPELKRKDPDSEGWGPEIPDLNED
jgi:hypothetical protein